MKPKRKSKGTQKQKLDPSISVVDWMHEEDGLKSKFTRIQYLILMIRFVGNREAIKGKSKIVSEL